MMELRKPEVWSKKHTARYLAEQPRKILALDGGGIRGVITLQVLKRIEDIIREHTGKKRLCDYFDFIGGTSTGAIIAAGLAIGKSVDNLIEFYDDAGPSMFVAAGWLERHITVKYDETALIEKLKEVYDENRTLTPDELECLLLVVTRNATTDSFWPISSNPDAKYCAQDRGDCNLKVKLWQLVRASTAAPTYFRPEYVRWDPKDETKSFVFVDGGTTPYNNPAFLMYRMATLEPYNLRWPKGERNLQIISVGTGSAPGRPQLRESNWNKAVNAEELIKTLMYSASVDQDTNCRTFGHCVHGDKLDSEIGSLCNPDLKDLGRDFLYARYDAELTEKGLKAIGCFNVDPERVKELDAVAAVKDLKTIGAAVANQVKPEHFGTFLKG